MIILRLDRIERAISLSLSLFLGLFILICIIWGATGPDPEKLPSPHLVEIQQPANWTNTDDTFPCSWDPAATCYYEPDSNN